VSEITLPHNWSRRPDQKALWDYLINHDRDGRAVGVMHRQWGKDTVALHAEACMLHMRIGNYWHMLPKYEQARIAIWESVNPDTGLKRIDEAFPVELRKRTDNSSMIIEFHCGSNWRLVGSDAFDRTVSAQPVWITFSEWALANPMAWVFLQPMIERNHGNALWIYTPRGDNHGKSHFEFAQKEPGWFAQSLRADQTPVFKPDQLDRILRQLISQLGDEAEAKALFEQEYMCSFMGAVRGAYYTRQMAAAEADGRISRVPWQPNIEVNTYWDLGVRDSMAIWFIQHVGKAHHVIDYYENTGFGLEHYANEMQKKPYKYGNHYMPHDAEAREMTSGEIALSRKEVAENLGIKPVITVPRAQNMNLIMQVHIPAVRNVLPSCWFDREKCAVGISALKTYSADWDEEKRILAPRPAENWAIHGADAFRTFAVGYESIKPKNKSVTEMMAEMGRIG
jgi:phage terminase large subunit